MQSTINFSLGTDEGKPPFVRMDKMAARIAASRSYDGKPFLEKLQQSLDLDKLCTIIASEAKKAYKLCGLSFIGDSIQGTMPGSQRGEFHYSFKLFVEGEVIGSLIYQAHQPLTSNAELRLTRIHQAASYSLRNACEYNKLLQRANQDSLTGLSNRSAYNEQMTLSLLKARKNKTTMGLILIDLNNFKPINDSFGHHIGDLVLIKFAQALTKSIRATDKCYRFGGDEFAVILEDASTAGCNAITHRLEVAIGECPVLSEYQLQFSSGCCFSDDCSSENELFVKADQRLYKDKENKKR